MRIEASYYKISKDLVTGSPEQNIYTNLADAVAAAPKDITVTGDVEVKSNIDIPKGTSVKFNDGKMTITKDGSVTVADGAKLTMGTGTVDGVLSVENKKNISGTYTSDVVTSDDVSVLYSGLAYALSNAVSGQTVKISTTAGATVETSSDIEIKDGVTLDTNNKNLKINAGSTLTINGTLFLDNGTLSVGVDTAGLKEEGAVVLNGSIKSIASIQDSLGTIKVAGAYYTILEKSSLFNYVEPVKNAAAKASTFYNQSLTIVGEHNLGDITFTGTNDAPITVTMKDEVTGGTITLDYATLILDAQFTGTITDGKGQAVLSKVTGSSTEGKKLTFATADFSGVKTFSVEGDVSAIGDKGSMDLSGITVSSANLKEVYFGDDVVINGSVIATSAVINGKVIVKNEKTLLITGDSYVTGALEAAAKTDSKTAGKVTVKGCLFVGFDEPTLGANASVSGSVTVEKVMYVMAGSTVDPAMIEDMNGMVEFYVDGKLYMTAYAKNAGATLVGLPEYDLDDADVDGWYDENGNKITSASPMPAGKVSAKIDYNIYSVTIIADEGIGTVAVDGVVAVNYIGNIHIASNLAAGEHKVTYTVKNGYEGTAKLYFDGKEVSAITLSGDPEDESNFTYTLQGVTPAASVAPTPVVTPASSDDDMGLTEYLLIVLVILAAILVVVVAIRMMRS